MAGDDSITKKVIGDVRARKPSDDAMAVSLGCISQVIGTSALFAGCGLLLVVLGDLRRPLRYLGIRVETAPEIALSLIGLGVLILLLGDMPIRKFLEGATRHPSIPAEVRDDKHEKQGKAAPAP